MDVFSRRWRVLTYGVATSAILFSGLAVSGATLERHITVTYLPLKYFFDGKERVPPSDQQGFVYNNRTYVPLRFMSESLGKEVSYDPETYSIYVGRRTSELPGLWSNTQMQGEATIRMDYYENGALNLRGIERPDALLVTSHILPTSNPDLLNATSNIWAEMEVPEGATTLSGKLFVPVEYFGHAGSYKIGYLTILDELNMKVFRSDVLTTETGDLPFTVSITNKKKLRIHLTLFQYQGLPGNGTLIDTQIGLSDLEVQ